MVLTKSKLANAVKRVRDRCSAISRTTQRLRASSQTPQLAKNQPVIGSTANPQIFEYYDAWSLLQNLNQRASGEFYGS